MWTDGCGAANWQFEGGDVRQDYEDDDDEIDSATYSVIHNLLSTVTRTASVALGGLVLAELQRRHAEALGDMLV